MARKMKYVEAFDNWLRLRSPIDMIILGLGPDGHLAFLPQGSDPKTGQLASRVRLWPGLIDWKWGLSSEACICTRVASAQTCDLLRPPSHALTITLPTILTAKEIILMAFGPGKALPVYQLLEGEDGPQRFIAQYLWAAEGRVTIVLDEPAAAQLSRTSEACCC